jgi:3-oxoacyl-[acyl-carrier protein] reductase
VNLVAPFTLSQGVLPGMLKRGWGRIINLSSIGTKFGGSPGAPHYSVSKSALEALTRSLAKVSAERNVLINTVRVGVTWTAMQKKRMKNPARRAQMIPIRRMATPGEIANAIFFLTTEQASYISGATLDVSGGE